jgi:molybdopterin/thiamine biosynthesis adenylyltransferase
MIILSQELVAQHLQTVGLGGQVTIPFVSLDDGDAFIPGELAGSGGRGRRVVNGMLSFRSKWQNANIDHLPDDVDVRVVVHLTSEVGTMPNDFTCSAVVRGADSIDPHPVQLIPIREELFSRVRGLYETDVLQTKTVLIVGLGSGGGTIALELAKAGVGHFFLVDHDRLEIVNVVRHVCGISDIGRFKTKAVRDLILDKNPYADVETYETSCNEGWLPTLQQLVRRADIVFCCTDNRPSRTLVNRACVSDQRVCIYGGTFRRAYGGMVLRVIPGQTMCYQCFIDLLPEVAEDQEIASQAQAERIAYADRPVAVEPGLATDIAPIAIMCAKMGILEMLRGTETTLKNLYDDLSSSWYQWLNRREPDTEFANLKPLDSGEDDLRILAWYGVTNERNPGCPTCGNFVEMRLRSTGQKLTPEQIAVFEASSNDTTNDELLFPPS